MSKQRTEIEHALRNAGRAAKQGDLATADRWSKTAERLSAANAKVDEAEAAKTEEERMKQEMADMIVCDLFTKAAFIAHAMVHAPLQAPAAFQGLVKQWREQNLGEGEEDAERAAAKLAASQAAYLEGRFEDSLPDYVREQMAAAWSARREELEREPSVPALWAEE